MNKADILRLEITAEQRAREICASLTYRRDRVKAQGLTPRTLICSVRPGANAFTPPSTLLTRWNSERELNYATPKTLIIGILIKESQDENSIR